MKKLTLCIFGLLICSAMAVNAEGQGQPNIVVVVVDDLRWNEFSAAGHPYLQTPNIDRLANEGALFESSYTVSPLCSPNRASILTGQYTSRHGVVDNLARNMSSKRLDLFAIDLQKAGYKTAHVGKWHMGNDPTPRPGYDYWVSYPGQGRSVNPVLYEKNGLNTINGYMTDVLTDRAVAFIAEEHDQPFMLYLAHKAIHPEVKQKDDSTIDFSYRSKYRAADRHIGTYKDKVLPRRNNYQDSEKQPAFPGKPVLENALAYKNSDVMGEKWDAILDKHTSEETIRDRSEMLLAVDEGLGRIIAELDKRNILDNTLILLTSDNGYFYGEHGLSIERRMPYEEGVRVPLLIRYPELVKPGVRLEQFTLSIDIAPTLLDLAGAEIGGHVQGRSLLPLVSGKAKDWRDSFLIEFTSYEKPMPWLVDTGYKVIRKNQYKYIHWVHHQDKDELYNLEDDPYEQHNLIDEPEQKSVIKSLKKELGELVAEAVGL